MSVGVKEHLLVKRGHKITFLHWIFVEFQKQSTASLIIFDFRQQFIVSCTAASAILIGFVGIFHSRRRIFSCKTTDNETFANILGRGCFSVRGTWIGVWVSRNNLLLRNLKYWFFLRGVSSLNLRITSCGRMKCQRGLCVIEIEYAQCLVHSQLRKAKKMISNWQKNHVRA